MPENFRVPCKRKGVQKFSYPLKILSRKRGVNMSKIETSLDGYRHIGINLTQKQLEDLAIINTMMKEDTG